MLCAPVRHPCSVLGPLPAPKSGQKLYYISWRSSLYGRASPEALQNGVSKDNWETYSMPIRH
jgi:hypothetical protein